MTAKVIYIESQIYGCSALCDKGDDLKGSRGTVTLMRHTYLNFTIGRVKLTAIFLLHTPQYNVRGYMFGLWEASARHRVRLSLSLPSRPNQILSIIVGLTAVMIVNPTTFRLLQYLPLAALGLPHT